MKIDSSGAIGAKLEVKVRKSCIAVTSICCGLYDSISQFGLNMKKKKKKKKKKRKKRKKRKKKKKKKTSLPGRQNGKKTKGMKLHERKKKENGDKIFLLEITTLLKNLGLKI